MDLMPYSSPCVYIITKPRKPRYAKKPLPRNTAINHPTPDIFSVFLLFWLRF